MRLAFEKVMKFGGAALADGPAVERACAIVRDFGGRRPVVVVSAVLGATSLLDSVAHAAAQGDVDRDRVRIRHRSLLGQLGLDAELLDRYFAELASLLRGIAERRRLSPDERDLVLSYGERMSARIVARALQERGLPATPVDAYDLGLLSDSNHGAARPLLESRERVRAALLEVPGLPVVTGFLAKDRHGNLTTLGRNGSDLSAALLAEAVGASDLELWKSVRGLMTADPAIVPEARVIERMSFEDAAALASHGAEVLHPEALEPALRAGISVRFLDVRDPDGAGTVLGMTSETAGPIAIAVRRRLSRLSVRADSRPQLLRVLASEPALASGDGARFDAYVAAGPDLELRISGIDGPIEILRDLALVALVGRGASYARALESLSEADVDVVEAAIGAGRATQLFVVRAEEVERAASVVHTACFAGERARIS